MKEKVFDVDRLLPSDKSNVRTIQISSVIDFYAAEPYGKEEYCIVTKLTE